jgi:hypothetical protein
MNEAETITPPDPAPLDDAVPPQAARQLAALANAREIAERFLMRMDRVAEAMPPEELKEALADKGQMALNVTRMGRALRQIVVLELETMGLREPAVPRGMGSGDVNGGSRNGGAPNGSGPNGGGTEAGRHDFNDLNDLEDQTDLKGLYDLDDPFEAEEYSDLETLEREKTYEKYNFNRKRDWNMAGAKARADEAMEMDFSERVDAEKTEWTVEQHRAWAREFEDRRMACYEELAEANEARWRARHQARIEARKAERRAGRGPP